MLAHNIQTVSPGSFCEHGSKRRLERNQNGELLRLIETRFEVFITVDQGLEFQQKTVGTKIGIVVLKAVNNKVQTLKALVPEVLSVLNRIKPGQVIRVPESK